MDVHDTVYVFEEPYDYVEDECLNLIPFGQNARFQRWDMCHTIHLLLQPMEEKQKQLFYVLQQANIPHFSEDISDVLHHVSKYYKSHKSSKLQVHFYLPNRNYSNNFMIVQNKKVDEMAQTWPVFKNDLLKLVKTHGVNKQSKTATRSNLYLGAGYTSNMCMLCSGNKSGHSKPLLKPATKSKMVKEFLLAAT